MSRLGRASSLFYVFLVIIISALPRAPLARASSFEVTNQLTVDGASLLKASVTVAGLAAPPAPAAGQGAFYFDSSANRFLVSENAGGYTSLVPFQRNAVAAVLYPSVLTDLVGIGTASPLLTLDVNGAAQFGSGATKSTFTAAGVLQLASPLALSYGGTGANLSTQTVGALPYFGSSSALGGLGAGGPGFVLQSNGAAAPSWGPVSGLTAGTATTAQNLAGGAAGVLPYQSAPNTTLFTAAGSVPQVLQSGGFGAPTWTGSPTVSTLTVTGSFFSVGGTTVAVTGGQVGVGTASPAGALHVVGGGGTGLIIDSPSNTNHLTYRVAGGNKWIQYLFGNDLRFWDTTDRFTMASGGNVGIGTTGPTTMLDVRGTAASGIVTIDQANVAGNKFVRFTYSNVAGSYGSIGIQPNAIEYAIGPAVGNMAVTGGNLGIGTLAPNQLLDVNGGAQFGSGASKSTFTALGMLQLASPLAAAYGGTGANLSAATAGYLPYFSGAGVMSALAAGTAGYILQSNGAAAPSWTALSSITAGNATTALNLSGGAAGSLPYQSAANTTAMLAIASGTPLLQSNGSAAPSWVASPTFSTVTVTGSAFSVGGSTLVVKGGNVGIGTANPAYPLTVSGRILSGGLWVDGGGTEEIGTPLPTLMGLYDTAWNLVLANTGNVGIGTTAPATRLHLSSGTVTIDGTAATSLVTNATVGIGTSSTGPTLVVKSTSSTAGTTVADIRDNAGNSLVSVVNTPNGTAAGTATLLVNAGNASNAGGITVANIGAGLSGLDLVPSGGGSLSVNGFDASPTFSWTNKHAKFMVSGNANDPSSTQSYLFEEASQPAYLPEFVVREQAGQTGDVMQWQNSAGVAVASVTASGTIATSANMTAAGTITGSFHIGDGSLLTNMNASNLASGTLGGARLSGTYPNALAFGSAAAGPITVSTNLVVNAAPFRLGNFVILPPANQLGAGALVYRTADNIAYLSDGTNWSQISTGYQGPWNQDGVGHVTLYYSTNAVGIGITPLNKLDVSGNMAIGSYAGSAAAPPNGALIKNAVGVGTPNPLAALSINGSGGIGGANSASYDVGAGNIAAGNSIYSYGSICAGVSGGTCGGPNGNILDASSLRPGTANTNSIGNALYRFNKGWFGSGGLDVAGNIAFSGGYRIIGQAGAGFVEMDNTLGADLEYTNYGRFLADSLGAHVLAGTGAGVAELLTVRGSGNVGVSTANPAALFTVGSFGNLAVTAAGNVGIDKASPATTLDILAPNNGLQILSGAAGSYSDLVLGRTAADGTFGVAASAGQFAANAVAGDVVLREENAAGHLMLNAGAGAATLVVTNGSVGIGKTSPATALDVNGTATATLFSGSGASVTSLNASNVNTGLLGTSYGGTGANLSGATLGQIPYFIAGGTLAVLAAGASGSLLSSNGAAAPSWLPQSSLLVPTAPNMAGGSMGTEPVQTGPGTTLQLLPGAAGAVLQANGAAAPSWVTSPTLSTVTVTGNAFSVAGATFVVTGGLTGVGTPLPAYQLTVGGGANGSLGLCSKAGCLTGYTTTDYPTIKEFGSGGLLYFDINGTYLGYMDNTSAYFPAYKDFDNPAYYVKPAGAISAVLAGQVGIGLAPTGSNSLEVNGIMRATGGQVILTQSALTDFLTLTDQAVGSASITLNSANPLAIGANNSATQLVFVVSGNVGIGTAAPGFRLDVQGGSVNTPAAYGYMANGVQVLSMSGNILQHGFSASSNDESFLTGGVERMHIIFPSGNVGIGTGAPGQARLAVQGADSTNANQAITLVNNGNSGMFFVRNDKTAGFGFGPSDAATSPILTVRGPTNDATNWALQATQASYLPILIIRDDDMTAIGGTTFISTLTVLGGVTVATNTTASPALYLAYGSGNLGLGTNAPAQQLSLTRNMALPLVTPSAGIIYEGGVPWIHGDQNMNFFAQQNAGNMAGGGSDNIAIGPSALSALTSGTNNVAIGTAAATATNIGSENVAVGPQALEDNTAGNYSVALGYQAGMTATGGYITAVGPQALDSPTVNSGSMNTAVGYLAMNANTASLNTGVGAGALFSNVSGVYNTAFGTVAGYTVQATGNTALGMECIYQTASPGVYNACVGLQSLYGVTSGSYDVTLGNWALYANTTGSSDTAVGYGAGYTATSANANTTGNGNTFIGYNAGPGTSTQLTNATAIGSTATVTANNSLILGNGAFVGIGLTAPTAIMEVQTADDNYAYVQTNGTITLGDKISSAHASGGIGTISNHPFQIYTSNLGPVMTWTAGGTGVGNVGINTATPASKLVVSAPQVGTLATIEGNESSNAFDVDSTYGGGSIYLPGFTWNTVDNGVLAPKAGIWTYVDNTGSRLMMGTSNNYLVGITTVAVTISTVGFVGIEQTNPQHPIEIQAPNSLPAVTDGALQAYTNGTVFGNAISGFSNTSGSVPGQSTIWSLGRLGGITNTVPSPGVGAGLLGHQYGTGSGGYGVLASYGANPTSPTNWAYLAGSGVGAYFGGPVEINGNLKLDDVISCVGYNSPPATYCPSIAALRHTPNLHLNAQPSYAVIANWDNGTTGSALTFRVGNGSGSGDSFDVWADGEFGLKGVPGTLYLWGSYMQDRVGSLHMAGGGGYIESQNVFYASGDVFNTSPTQGQLGVSGTLPGIGGPNYYPTLRCTGAYLYFSAGNSYSAYMNSGGSWTTVSDRKKKNVWRPVDAQDILRKLDLMPMFEWNYKFEDRSIRHIAPVAQDFHEQFHLNGPGDTMISNIDPAGVAIVGVKALSVRRRAQDAEIGDLMRDIEEIKAELAKQERSK